MRYSIQQIKFEFISAIREIDDDAGRWNAAIVDQPPEASLRQMGFDPSEFVYVAKPAVSPRAAALVLDFMADRMGVRRSLVSDTGHWAMMFRRLGTQ
jgi:hypothetical protein